MWRVRCSCGLVKDIQAQSLTSGKSTNCRCKQSERHPIKHGHARHGDRAREYIIRKNLRQRCNNPRNTGYKNYGGRGIKVCKRWDRYERFIADMGKAPNGLTLERINNDGDYKPSNCKWATRTEQARNTRQNVMVTIGGKTQCLSVWCKELNVPEATVHWRRREKNMTPKEALTTKL